MSTDTLGSRRRRSSKSVQVQGSSWLRRLPLLPALLLAALLVYLGARLLLAGIAAYQAQRFLEDWSSKGQEPQPRAWQIAHDAAQRAIALYPADNGEYLEQLARIQQWQQISHPPGADSAKASRQAARDSFRAAIAARPTWPYNWTGLAGIKLQLLEIDEEFAEAMQQAHRHAPTRLDINRSLAQTGLLAWMLLDEEEEALTLEAARHTFIYNQTEARQLAEFAETIDLLEDLCEYLDATQTDTRQLCD